ncbi:MAG: DUF58 domain-containing protein [Treponema sp.]|nr:DUF58 domain-containing protein [Treponema sp.]
MKKNSAEEITGAEKKINSAKKNSDGRLSSERNKLFSVLIIFFILIFIFTPVYIAQFICLFFIFILVCSRIYSWYLVNHIRVTRMDSELRVFRHEWARIELKIENNGILPAFMLVSSDSPGDLSVVRIKKTFCSLFKQSWTLLCWDGLCADRGIFNVGPAVIKGSDPLGLFPFHITEKETTKIYVYPSVRSINIKNSRGIPLGNMINTNPLYEDLTRYRSLRPYYPGDERRRINWKASAKLNQLEVQSGHRSLLINEYEASASYPVMLFLNVNWDDYHFKNRRFNIERIIEAAAALCLKASRERQSFGIIIYTLSHEGGISVIPASASSPIPILERLAALDYSKSANSAEPEIAHNSVITMLNYGRHLSYGTRYIYAGPDLGDEAYITLNLLKKHHLSLEYLVIDERTMLSVVPGNSPRHQIKESGYDII